MAVLAAGSRVRVPGSAGALGVNTQGLCIQPITPRSKAEKLPPIRWGGLVLTVWCITRFFYWWHWLLRCGHWRKYRAGVGEFLRANGQN